MKSGAYSMVFSCDGYRGYGDAQVLDQALTGGSDRYEVSGHLRVHGNRLISQVQVELAPGVSGNSFIRGGFPCLMTGSEAEYSFNLYGAGPLGIIIGIECQWSGPLEERSTGIRFRP
jgi:hypothetical protein